MLRKLGLAVVPVLAIVAWASWPRSNAQQHPPVSGDNGSAPIFKLIDLNGREFDSSQLKGSVVVLDFWATWCAPCIADIPMFNRLQEKYGPRGLKVVAPAMQSGWAQDIKPIAEKYGIKYTILIGDEKVAEQYPYVGLPATFLIGRDGKIARKFIGTIPDKEGEKEGEFEREIQRLLQGS